MVRPVGLFVHTAGPNTALVKSSGRKDVRIVIGGRMFSIPGLQRVDRLSLELRTISVHTTSGLTVNGVSIDMTSACQVKIQGWSTVDDMSVTPSSRAASTSIGSAGGRIHMDQASIRLAAQHFLGKSDQEIESAIQKTIAGHQRAIIGSLTVEELYRDREAFSRRVLELIAVDMRNMGLGVVSYTVAEISDGNGYIDALGVTQTETVKREAAEGAALHQSAARSRSAEEDAQAHLKVNQQMERKIESDKQRAITNAKAQQLIQRQLAIQKKAHDISSAEQDAVLLVTKQKAKAAETQAELEVIKQQVEKEKLIKKKHINVEADAQLYKAQVSANSIRAEADAEAYRIRLIGEANAEAIRRQGLAEVEILRERNKAWTESYVFSNLLLLTHSLNWAIHVSDYWLLECCERRVNSAAILEKMIEIMPQVAKAIAEPLAKTEKMVFVSSGGSGGGPAAFGKDFNRIVAEVPEMVNALTGIDMRKAVEGLASGKTGHAVLQGAAEGIATGMVYQTDRTGML